ncbi:LpqB family beta-propeller domain-containing protein [Nocardioides speluncae]|uniref:LpqB family beta-propeller domain-containing protein n=1 Tax=Nocardioides speluncae TaxID=2670337 RepID=UPI000D68C198|nr:LpqB family beta-propeller domain-containing protein [Nocardioides speluncae]
MSGRSSKRGLIAGVVSVLLAGLLSGCMTLPESGPVEEVDVATTEQPDSGRVPPPPAPDSTFDGIVRGFLDAMTAEPVSTTVAKEYLMRASRSRWHPDRAIITYTDADVSGSDPVQVRLQGAEKLNSRGAWVEQLTEDESTLEFDMGWDGSQPRIEEAPNALVVPRRWFDDQFVRQQIYFFDVAAQILVPEAVYVPRGAQLATSLVRSLVHGPPADGQLIARTYLPTVNSVSEVRVDVQPDGLAEIDLPGSGAPPSADQLRMMIAQLQWTLRQDPSILQLRVTMDGRLVSGPNDVDVDGSQPYDPAYVHSPTDLYGISDGRLGRVVEEKWTPVRGAFGSADYQLGRAAVDLDGGQKAGVAGVTADARTVYLAQIDDGEAPVEQVIRGSEVLAPAWDVSGRLWLIDRSERGARVWHFKDGRLRPVYVPGISGKRVVDFLVSRDGTRIVAAVRRATGDALVVSRLEHNVDGSVSGATGARLMYAGTETVPFAVQDLAWQSPTNVLVLRKTPNAFTQLSIVPLGAAVSDEPADFGEAMDQDMVGVAASPQQNSLIYCTNARGEIMQVSLTESRLVGRQRIRALTYVG